MAQKIRKKVIEEEKNLGSKEEKIKKIKIGVLGIGGGGGNIVAEISQRTKAKISFVVADTDFRALKDLPKGVEKFHFGQSLTKGLGTGINPSLAAEAAKREKEEIKKIFSDYDLVIVVATLGGGVGSGAAPAFAQISKSLGNLTYGIFTFPFFFEGKRKKEIAQKALWELKKELNAFSLLPNERIFQMVDKNTPLAKAFSAVNKSLAESIQNLTEIIFRPALMNIDFADLRTIFEGRGLLTYLNSVEVNKEEKEKAIERIIHFPLYPYSIDGAKGVLINIAGANDLSLGKVNEISRAISERIDKEAKFILGISRIEKSQGTRVTILATGVISNSEEIPVEKKPIEKKCVRKKPTKEKPRFPQKKKNEEKIIKVEVSQKPEGESLVRKNGLQLKKEIEKEEAEILMKEKFWEVPAFLRRKRAI